MSWRGYGRKIFAVLFLIGLANTAIYAQVLDHEFVDWDDFTYFVDSPALDGHLGQSDLVSAFTEIHVANWSPMTTITILIQDALHGPVPALYLLGNAVLHFLTAGLLFLWLFRMTDRLLPSAWVALVFAVHPLHVESVAWSSERKDVLAGALWMACLLAYAYYCERPNIRRHAGVLALAVLAGLSKPTVVALPVTLVLLDYWPLGRLRSWQNLWPLLREKRLIIGVSLLVAVLTVLAQTAAGANSTSLAPWTTRVLNAGLSYWTYLVQTFWPQDMAVFYPYPDSATLGGWAPLAAWAMGLGITGLALWTSSRKPYILMGWLWFVLTLVPTMGFIQVGGQAHADRYMYVPMIGVLVLVAWLLADTTGRGAVGRFAWAGAFLASVIYLALARVQASYWQDSTTLFEHALEVTENNSIAHRYLGVAYWADGDRRAGEAHLRASLAISPDWAESRIALADALNQSGRYEEARAELAAAASMGHESPAMHAALGVAAQGLGDDRLAITEYQQALGAGLLDWQIMNNLAWILVRTSDAGLRDPEESIRWALQALEQVPGHPDVEDTLEAAIAVAGRSAPAEIRGGSPPGQRGDGR